MPTVISVHVIVVLLCCVIGLPAYAAYGDNIRDIVFYNLPQGDNVATLIELLYIFNIMGSFTITI